LRTHGTLKKKTEEEKKGIPIKRELFELPKTRASKEGHLTYMRKAQAPGATSATMSEGD